MSSLLNGVLQWLGGDDTGASSKCLALAVLGAPSKYVNYPHDPDDLGRCLRLIERVPEVRAHLDSVRPLHPVWNLYVQHWDELEALYRAEVPNHQGRAPQLYDLMHQLQNKATLNYTIAAAVDDDIKQIKRIASRNSKALGYVRAASLTSSAARGELTVAIKTYAFADRMGRGMLIGFVNWHKRRDGWTTIYEIAVASEYRRAGVGKALLAAVPTPTRLKCTQDNTEANAFYAANGFVLAGTEPGRQRALNIWERRG